MPSCGMTHDLDRVAAFVVDEQNLIWDALARLGSLLLLCHGNRITATVLAAIAALARINRRACYREDLVVLHRATATITVLVVAGSKGERLRQ